MKIKNSIEKHSKKKSKINITKEKLQAIRNLKTDKTIKIIPADKGNATVIMDMSTYNQKMEEIIKKGNYSVLKKDPTPTIERKIAQTLRKYKQLLPEETIRELTPH